MLYAAATAAFSLCDLSRSNQKRSTARSTGFDIDCQIFRLSDLATFTRLGADGVVAAGDDDDRHLAADDPEVAQHLDSGMRTQRKVERDAVKRRFLHELGGLVVSRRARGRVANLGCHAADNHAVEIIVVDDEKTRRADRRRGRGGQIVLVCFERSSRFEHSLPAKFQSCLLEVIREVREIRPNAFGKI